MAKSTYLFEKFSHNLGAVLAAMKVTINDGEFAHHERLYLCPLSLKVFSQLTLDHNAEDSLTREHVPPKNSYGQIRCLTAKDVNNNATSLDIKLEDRAKFVDASRYGFPLMVKAKVDNALNYKLIMDLNNEKPIMKFIGHMENPVAQNLVKEMSSGGTFKVNFKVPSDKASPLTKISYLKNAYLLAFSDIGYEFIFGLTKLQHPYINKLRCTIIDKDVNEDLSFVQEVDFPDNMEGLSIMRLENNLTALAVCYSLPLKSDNKLKVRVIFPNPNDINFEFKNHLKPGSLFHYYNITHLIPKVGVEPSPENIRYWDLWHQDFIE